jgi:ferredoxin
MTEQPVKMKDLLEEAEKIACPVRRTLSFVEAFLEGPMCGRCFPCSMGSYEARKRLTSISTATGTEQDMDALRTIAEKMLVMSMCKRGKDTARVILDNMGKPDFGEHLAGRCRERMCTDLIEYRIVPEKCTRCGLCLDACRDNAIVGEKQVSYKSPFLPFEIRQKRCTKCGDCIKVCPTDAIVVVNIETEAPVGA